MFSEETHDVSPALCVFPPVLLVIVPQEISSTGRTIASGVSLQSQRPHELPARECNSRAEGAANLVQQLANLQLLVHPVKDMAADDRMGAVLAPLDLPDGAVQD